MQKILVTGATGFIGNYVIEALLKQNVEVVATGTNILNAQKKPWFGRVQFIPFDLKQFDNTINYQAYFQYPASVIHLAWEGLPNYKSAFHVEENLPRHFAFLKNLVAHGQRDITVTGTCFEYGMQEGCLSETMETHPVNSYALAKDLLRKQLESLQNDHTFMLKWVRLFYMYGQGQSSNSLLSQLDRSLEKGDAIFNMSGGMQVRDYLPVEAVAQNILNIALQDRITGVINCCSGVGITVKAFVERYLRDKNKNISLNLGYYPYADYEPMAFWGDDSKLKLINQ